MWNTLIAHEHPRGMTTFAGRQVRYLIGSAHGWLGAARDRWMAWDDETRRAHLDRVVCLSRFLIRPSARCPRLASHALGRILRRLPSDFQARYGFRPYVVESFADEGYDGVCLRAANFLCVGRTAGRGRQDREKRRAETVKTVFMREMERGWRRKLGVPHVGHAPALAPGEGLSADVWAENEFGGAPLGDKRLAARLVKSAGLLAAYPGQKINAGSAADNTAVSAFYRMIEMPAETAVTARNILAPHRGRSVMRMRGQATVLAIQDGTDLNFSRRPGCGGLQLIGKNQTGAAALGLHLHATLAVTGTGLPLGVLRLGFDEAAERAPEAEKRKKTERWLDALADTAGAAREVSRRTRVISVCDREADCFEMFDAQRRHPRVELLACCELRFRRVTVSAVHVRETAPPEGEDPVQWFLLTTVKVRSAEDAAETVGFYLQRWRIEDYFRVLKSGCRVEHLLFRTADRLQRAVAINAVIAWRIMVMTLLGRQVPDCEPQLMFTDNELGFLRDYAQEHGLTAPDRLGGAVSAVAHLGGYRGRRHDPDPGNQIMWHGQTRLSSTALGHRIGFRAGQRHALQQEE